MDICLTVEKELEKVLSKFTALREHTQRALGDIATSVDNIKKEISEGIYIYIVYVSVFTNI